MSSSRSGSSPSRTGGGRSTTVISTTTTTTTSVSAMGGTDVLPAFVFHFYCYYQYFLLLSKTIRYCYVYHYSTRTTAAQTTTFKKQIKDRITPRDNDSRVQQSNAVLDEELSKASMAQNVNKQQHITVFKGTNSRRYTKHVTQHGMQDGTAVSEARYLGDFNTLMGNAARRLRNGPKLLMFCGALSKDYGITGNFHSGGLDQFSSAWSMRCFWREWMPGIGP